MTKEIYNDNFYGMGTRLGFVFPGCSSSKGGGVSSLIKEEIERLESKISRFKSGSAVSFINKTACKKPVAVEPELWDVINDSISYSKKTFGAFDITLRAVAAFWNGNSVNDDKSDEFQNKLDLILNSVGMNKIVLDEKECSVFFSSPNVELDFGAIGKGLALKSIDGILMQNEIKNAFISFGESSILAMGNHPGGNSWRIGIPNIFGCEKYAYSFEINDCSVSTSGNTINNSIPGRVNIINPFTGYPVKEFRTIVASDKNPILAEVLSTAFMVLNDEQIIEVLSNFPSAKCVKIEYNEEHRSLVTDYSNYNVN